MGERRTTSASPIAGIERATLVLGAGVSHTRGVPLWPDLVHLLWKWTFGERTGDYRGPLASRLGRARRILAKQGWSDELVRRIDLPIHPFELQFAIELVRRALDDREIRTRVAKRLARRSPSFEPPPEARLRSAHHVFTELLRKALYFEYRPWNGEPQRDTLSVIAELLRRDRGRRIVRVISFNADDLLEREILRGAEPGGFRVRAITRARDRLIAGTLPIYHVHGYLPPRLPPRRRGREPSAAAHPDAREALVFTDAQYWASVVSPLSFANRVFVNALHDSQCVFVGLSMTDVDVIRWLGSHAYETGQEMLSEGTPEPGGSYSGGLPRGRLGAHFWIRRDAEDPAGLLSRFLGERGVTSVTIRSWDPGRLERTLAPLSG